MLDPSGYDGSGMVLSPLHPSRLAELDALLLREGFVCPVADDDLATIPDGELTGWCVLRGVYCVPSHTLIEVLRSEIGNRHAIEICGGDGVLGRSLGIESYDNRHQEAELTRLAFRMTGQAPVRYGPNIIASDALDAVRRICPDVVVGSWVTHRSPLPYTGRADPAGGSVTPGVGVAEGELVERAAYLFVGNARTHAGKQIARLEHTILARGAPWLRSRARSQADNVLIRWDRCPRKRSDLP